MKVIINKCYGGFGFSKEAIIRMRELGYERANSVPINEEEYNKKYPGTTIHFHDRNSYSFYDDYNNERTNPIVIQVVEELKDKASGQFAELKIVEIPDDIKYGIEEYDGIEWVAEKHRTWD